MLLRAYPHAVNLADGRAILFASNGGWKIATAITEIEDLVLADKSATNDESYRTRLVAAESEAAFDEVPTLGAPSSVSVPASGEELPLVPGRAASSGGGGAGGAAGGSGAGPFP